MELKKKMARRKTTIARSTRFAPTFESLEQRQLLAANVLANGLLENINFNNAGETQTLQLEVTANEPLILAFDMRGDGLDPGRIAIESVSGHTIAPIASTNGPTESMFLAELGPGSYEITVLGDNGTTGSYDFRVSLVGDLDGSTTVSSFEQMWAQAAIAQSNGSLNSYTASYYAQFGIPVGQNLFDANLDANRDGSIDPQDYSCIANNVGNGSVTVKLINDDMAPEIEANLVNDTGVSDTDHISSDITITGKITDKSEIAIFKAGIDGMDEADYVSILAERDASGNFTLDRAELEAIAGTSLDDGQEHTLYLIGIDEHDNGLGDVPYAISFTLDTETLSQPTQDLAVASDTGDLGDQYTSETTVTIEGTADPNTKLTLLETGATTTSDASGYFSFANVDFSFGDNEITIRAESVLGGVISDSVVTYTQNNAPTAVAIDPVTINENDGQVVVATLSDIFKDVNIDNGDNDALTYTVTSALPAWLSDISITNGKLKVTTEGELYGTSTITIKATDSYGEFIEGSVELIVAPENDAPTGSDLPPFINGFKDEASEVTDVWKYFADEETPSNELTLEIVSSLNGNAVIENGKLTFTPNPGYYGSNASVTINVTDKEFEGIAANTTAQTLFFNIANQNHPVVANDVTANPVDEDNVLNILIDDTVAHDEETVLDDLTFEIASGTDIGNGEFQVTGGKVKIVQDGGNRYFRFTPDENWNGTTSFDYKVIDQPMDPDPASDATGTVSFTITPINDAPVANEASPTIAENSDPLEIAVGDLVSDVETALGDLTITLGPATNGTIELVDVAGVPTFRFTPDTNFNGTAGFTYSVTDTGDGSSAALTSQGALDIIVTPVNDAPTANTTSRTIDENGFTEIDLRTLVSDTETPALNGGSFTFNVSGAVNGTVERMPDGYTARFTPDAYFSGDASFTYTVTDSGDHGAAAESTGPITINVSVTPLPPSTPDLVDASDLGISPTDNWTADNMPMFTVTTQPGVLVEIYSDIAGKVGEATSDASGVATITVSELADGTHVITAKAQDGNGNTRPTSGGLSVVIDATAPAIVSQDLAAASDTGTLGDRYTSETSVTIEGVADPNTELTLVETGATTTSDASGNFSFTNVPFAYGENPITIRTQNNAGAENNLPVTYTQNNAPELGTQIGTLTYTENDGLQYQDLSGMFVDANTADGDTLTFKILSNTNGELFSSISINSDRLDFDIEGTKSGSTTVTIRATDSYGETFDGTIDIDITSVNDEPVMADTPFETFINETFTIDLWDYFSDEETADADLVFSNVASPSGLDGTYTLRDGHLVDFVPTTDYLGLATFNVTVTDQAIGGSANVLTKLIHGTVVERNAAPEAANDSVTVDENGSVDGNVLTNDSDPDNDTLTVTTTSVTTTEGITVTIDPNTGAFTYDISSSTAFDSLAPGDTATDSFDYTISDGNGKTDTATVTITINGVNDAPVGVNDTATTDESTAINIDVLDNDSDVDSTTLTVGNLQATSTKGASISVNQDGTIKYDPSSSTTLQLLANGQQTTDTFTYTVNDGTANSATVTVTITVDGLGNDAPQVDNPIADLSLSDGDPQPALIDLTTVFSDPNSHNLSFTAVSSNTEIVNVQIVDGTKLQITYTDYNPAQDRTPAEITVTATETDSGESLTAQDVFTVTVAPIQPMEVYLVVRDTVTNTTTAEKTTTLPSSIDTVSIGDTYFVEVWLINHYPDGSGSFGSAVGNLGFDNSLCSATSVGHAGIFDSLTDGVIDNANGEIVNFGGANFSSSAGAAVAPDYSRLGYVEFNATAVGTQNFTFSPSDMAMVSSGALFDLSQINIIGASVTHQTVDDTYSFDLDSSSVTVSGTIGGESLGASPGQNDTLTNSYLISGSMAVAFDDYDTPTNMTIASGTLDPGLYDGPDLPPGIGGIDSTAPANFGLANDSIKLAIRNLNFSFTSNSLPVTAGTYFVASDVSIAFSSGTIDYLRSNGSHGSIDLTSEMVSIKSDASGSIQTFGANKAIYYTCEYTVDLSSVFGANSEIVFAVTIDANYDASAPSIMGTVAVEDTPTDIAMSVVKDPTVTDAKGEVASVPQSETWIDEWDAHWVEVWVKTEEGPGVDYANVDITYNAEYFTATEIEYSPAVIGDFTGDILNDGIVSKLGGTFDSSGVGVDGYVLLGRVKFESLADDGVELDVESFGVKPFDLGLELSVNDLNVNGVTNATVGIDRAPTTELWAMPYDVNNDDVINLSDVTQFVSLFQTNVLDSNSALAQVVDYNNDGKVNLSDLTHLVANFGTDKASGEDVSFPETFTQRWIGRGLDTTGESTTGELLDAATEIWQTMLGTNDPIDIQLVVTDLGGSQLAEAEILATDENGQPIAGRITLDDDAAGLGWYSQIDGTPDAEMYDLYTVMLHEIGHTLGFMGSYDGFGANLEEVDGQVTFVDEGISVTMDGSGNHVTDTNLGDDLMSSTLDPGVRKLPSELDAQMILAAYEAAEGGASGFAAVSAPDYGWRRSRSCCHHDGRLRSTRRTFGWRNDLGPTVRHSF